MAVKGCGQVRIGIHNQGGRSGWWKLLTCHLINRCGTLGAEWSLEPSAWCGVGDVLVPDGGEPLPGSYQFDIGINCQHGLCC